MWRSVALLLARDFSVVCADLRGYGRSRCPVSAPDHAPYAKRAMAQDMVIVMERLGFPRFSVAEGHRLDAGHFFPEEAPEQTAEALRRFFGATESQSADSGAAR